MVYIYSGYAAAIGVLALYGMRLALRRRRLERIVVTSESHQDRSAGRGR